jgi:NADPH2:quinone reductase
VKILEQCTRLFDQAQLQIKIGATFGLAEAAAAHRLLELGSMAGKIVLLIE